MTEARTRHVPAPRAARTTRRSTRPDSSLPATPTGCWRGARSSARRAGSPTSSRCRTGCATTTRGPPRATATRCRAAYGVKDSIRDVLPAELTEPFLDSIDRLIRELNRRGAEPDVEPATAEGLDEAELIRSNASSRNGEGTAGSYSSVSDRRARVQAT